MAKNPSLRVGDKLVAKKLNLPTRTPATHSMVLRSQNPRNSLRSRVRQSQGQRNKAPRIYFWAVKYLPRTRARGNGRNGAPPTTPIRRFQLEDIRPAVGGTSQTQMVATPLRRVTCLKRYTSRRLVEENLSDASCSAPLQKSRGRQVGSSTAAELFPPPRVPPRKSTKKMCPSEKISPRSGPSPKSNHETVSVDNEIIDTPIRNKRVSPRMPAKIKEIPQALPGNMTHRNNRGVDTAINIQQQIVENPESRPCGIIQVPSLSPEDARKSQIQETFSAVTKRLDLAVLEKNNFQHRESLMEGGFGQILTATSLYAQHQKVALKKFKINCESPEELEARMIEHLLECKLQSKANHPNIAKHMGCFLENYHCFFVMEFYERGDLFSLIYQYEEGNNNSQIDIDTCKLFAFQLASAVEYMHFQLGHIHMDIKPENIMVASTQSLQISDFGCAVEIIGLRDKHRDRGGKQGTEFYYTSEYFREDDPYFDSTYDVWGIGCVVFEMLKKKRPFCDPGDDRETIRENVKRIEEGGDYPDPHFEELEVENPLAYAFIRKIFVKREERPLSKDLLLDEWIQRR